MFGSFHWIAERFSIPSIPSIPKSAALISWKRETSFRHRSIPSLSPRVATAQRRGGGRFPAGAGIDPHVIGIEHAWSVMRSGNCSTFWHFGHWLATNPLLHKMPEEIGERHYVLPHACLFQSGHIGVPPFQRHHCPGITSGRGRLLDFRAAFLLGYVSSGP